jgi:ABC-type Fe3+ transport system permease subunit
VPLQALIVTHFILMNDFGLINTWGGIILPQLIVPIVVIVYRQFFDSIPREYREAALIDGASEFRLFTRVFLPMNWGVTTALAIVTFIGAWNAFLWPFLVTNTDQAMTVTVGIVQVHSAYGVQYARDLASAVMAALPVAIAYFACCHCLSGVPAPGDRGRRALGRDQGIRIELCPLPASSLIATLFCRILIAACSARSSKIWDDAFTAEFLSPGIRPRMNMVSGAT